MTRSPEETSVGRCRCRRRTGRGGFRICGGVRSFVDRRRFVDLASWLPAASRLRSLVVRWSSRHNRLPEAVDHPATAEWIKQPGLGAWCPNYKACRASVDEPWEHPDGVLARCVEPIVDHAAEPSRSPSYRQVRVHPVPGRSRTALSIIRG
jgi:hypothetical protein